MTHNTFMVISLCVLMLVWAGIMAWATLGISWAKYDSE